MSKREKKPVDPEAKIGVGKFWAWQSRELSDAAIVFLVGYVQLFCTDVIKVNPLLVGTVLMMTKIIDGITDLLAGYIVDRTETRFGKGRPYDFCLIGTWVTFILLFACPQSLSDMGKVAWVAVFYTLSNAVFTTFLNAGENVFMLRAFNKKQIVRFTAFGGLVTSLGGLLVGIIIPQLLNNAGNDPVKWVKSVAMVGIPLAAIGMCRFIFVKERTDISFEDENTEKVTFKTMWELLKKNRYFTLFMLIGVFSNTVGNMGMGIYFFKHVLGNLGLQSIFSAFSALAVVALVILPKLMEKFSIKQILIAGFIISAVTNLISFIFYTNVPILVVCYVISLFATVPGVYIVKIVMFDNADYNEYLGLPRMEGTMGAINGFANRLGTAFGAFLLGVVLTLIGYNTDAEVQTQATLVGLRYWTWLFPLVATLLKALMWKFYDLEKKLPEIHNTLEERKAKTVENA